MILSTKTFNSVDVSNEISWKRFRVHRVFNCLLSEEATFSRFYMLKAISELKLNS